ncbi:MAG: 4-hydroxy-tetrahydrodipicolinate reductase [Gemmatimonadota bacterium]|nr:4-hydroxy-tetrahydrodipicolinate reductase [Gemmatimonadota bacterium]
MIEVVVSGAPGRMGRAVCQAVVSEEDMCLAGAVGAPARSYIGEDIGSLIGIGPQNVPIEEDMGAALRPGRTLVEFSTPAATMAHAEQVKDLGMPLIIGTTGLEESHHEQIVAWTDRMPCLLAPNMSVGANLLFRLSESVSSLLPDFDVEIIEAHHRFKRDAPSGTASHLAERVARARRHSLKDTAAYGRDPSRGARQADEIGIHSVRAGDVVGEHTVVFGGLGERIELTHRVHSGNTFVYGTIRAIRYLQDQPSGLYTMADVIENIIEEKGTPE